MVRSNAVYFLTTLQTGVAPLIALDHAQIYQNMSLIAIFTMVFISSLAAILVHKRFDGERIAV